MLVLLAAAGAAVLAPLDRTGCGPPVTSLVRQESPLPPDEPPGMDPEVVRADSEAVAAAQRALGEHAAAVQAAQKTAAAAEALGESAREARYEAGDDFFEEDYDFDVSMAESALESAEYSVELAQDNLDYYLDQQAQAADDGYLGPDFYDDMVADARERLAQAQAALREAKGELSTARADQSAAEADQQAEDAEAASLTEQARAAEDEARRVVGQAVDTDTRLREALDDAEEAQDEHRAAHEQAVADWTRRHVSELHAVRFVNNAVADCRAAGVRSTIVAGVLVGWAALTALLLRSGARRDNWA